MQRWAAWLEEHKAALVNPGTPVGMSKTVSADGVEDHGGANPIMGFSIVEAGSMEAALSMAQSCPSVEVGTIEVAEMMTMPSAS